MEPVNPDYGFGAIQQHFAVVQGEAATVKEKGLGVITSAITAIDQQISEAPKHSRIARWLGSEGADKGTEVSRNLKAGLETLRNDLLSKEVTTLAEASEVRQRIDAAVLEIVGYNAELEGQLAEFDSEVDHFGALIQELAEEIGETVTAEVSLGAPGRVDPSLQDTIAQVVAMTIPGAVQQMKLNELGQVVWKVASLLQESRAFPSSASSSSSSSGLDSSSHGQAGMAVSSDDVDDELLRALQLSSEEAELDKRVGPFWDVVNTNFVIRKSADDGNCLFDSCLAGEERDPTGFRREVYDYMLANRETFQEPVSLLLRDDFFQASADNISDAEFNRLVRVLPAKLQMQYLFYIEGKSIYSAEEFDVKLGEWLDGPAFTDYCSAMANSKAYADFVEVRAIADVQGRPIRLYSEDYYIGPGTGYLDFPDDGHVYDPANTLHILYDRRHRHYDRLEPFSLPDPDQQVA